MKLTTNIKAQLRQDKIKLDGTIPIYFSIRIGAFVTRTPTGKFILLKDWDDKKECPKSNSQQNQLLAAYLNQKMSGFEMFILMQQSLGKPVTLTIAMTYFRENKTTLFSFMDEQVELWQSIRRSDTLKSYKSTKNVLMAFNTKLNFGDLSYETIQRFDLYMSKIRGNSLNGRYGKHKCLKAIINEAIKKGYMDTNPYRDFKLKTTASKRQFLSIAEIKKLMDYQVPEDEPFLEKAKDLFLFSCFTGLRYGDVISLKFGNIKSNPDAIKLKMSKTSKDITIPLVSNAKDILHKYSKHVLQQPSLTVLPKISNQVVNRNLKTLMENVGINKQISFHCARHSFASSHIQANTNLIYLKDLMGHSKVTETQVYAKSLESDLFNSMNTLQNMYDHQVAI